MNYTFLTGNIGGDAEVRGQSGNVCVAPFAWETGIDQHKHTCWIDLVALGAKRVPKISWLKKGMRVHVVGQLDMNEYTTNDGQKRRSFQVLVSNVYLAGDDRQYRGETRSEAQGAQQEFPQDEEQYNDELPF
jgi:single-stranded DNA-binding protein